MHLRDLPPMPYARPVRWGRRAAAVGLALTAAGAALVFAAPAARELTPLGWAATGLIVLGLLLALAGGGLAWVLTAGAFGRGLRQLWRR